MSLQALNNSVLSKMYDAAKDAVKSAELSKEDSVIHSSDERGTVISGRKWVVLGSRSDEFKSANLRTRQLFFENVAELFGGKDNIPADVLKEFKMGDFLLDKDGKVTSMRPLTARRIIAICELADKFLTDSPDSVVYGNVPGYSQLSPDIQAAYRKYLYAGAVECKTDIETYFSLDHDPKRFIGEEIARATSSDKFPSGHYLNEIARRLRGFGSDDAQKVNYDTLQTIFRFAKSLDSLGVDCLGLIRQKAGDLPARKQCLFLSRVLEAYEEKLAQFFGNASRVGRGREAKGEFPVLADIVEHFDFAQEIDAEPTVHDFTRFMSTLVDSHRTEYEQTKSKVPEILLDGDRIDNSKYDNIIEAISVFKKIAEDEAQKKSRNETTLRQLLKTSDEKSRFFIRWMDAVKQPGYDNTVYLNQYLDKFPRETPATAGVDLRAFIHERERFSSSGDDNFYPSTLTREGVVADKQFRNLTGGSPSGDYNPASLMLDTFNAFRGLGDLLLLCLDTDAKNGNTEKFDQLMDALNMPSRLSRCTEPILNLAHSISA